MKKILIDTNAYTSLLRGDEQVLDALGRAEIVYVSIFVMAELYAGFKGGSKESRNRQQLEQFIHKPTVRTIDATQETAQIFGEIKHTLKKAGNPIPIHDVWIAAHAMETGSEVVTYDGHFQKVPGLRLWDGA